MTYFEKENALVIIGGRNDREKVIHNDIFLLTMDSLEWIEVINIYGNCENLKRADHLTVYNEDSDFIIFGGIDENY